MQKIDFSQDWQFSFDQTFAVCEHVTLPHAAVAEPEVIAHPWEGLCYYRKCFELKEEWRGKIIHLEIGGAMQTAQVFLNGKYCFTHFGGYQRFLISLHDDGRFGEINTVELRLDNRPSMDMAPGKPLDGLDFCYHSGLYREAALHLYDLVHISDPLAVAVTAGGGVFIRTLRVDGNMAQISCLCHVQHEVYQERRFAIVDSADQIHQIKLELSIVDPAGATVVQTEQMLDKLKQNCDHTFAFELDIPAAQLWSPDHPALYQAKFIVRHNGEVVDVRRERFGIRTVEFKRDGFYLNGGKFDLIGSNRHMEYPVIGNAVPANAQKRDAVLLKEGGLNWVRLSHYNQHPAFIESCDELGVLVMAAIPGWQQYHVNEHFINNTLRDARELVREGRNHPSIMIWEMSLNETFPPNWFNRALHDIAHEEYPGPYCFTCGDTYGFFEDWDVLFFHDHLKTDKPVVIREYGDWAFGGNESTSRQTRGGGRDKLLQQSWNFQWTLNRARAIEGVVATADWVFIDYNRGYHPDIERSGSLDVFRCPKYKYHFYRSLNSSAPMVYIADDWQRAAAGDTKVVIYSNCDEVELWLNGQKVAAKCADDGPDTPYTVNGASPDWETAMLINADQSGGNPFDGGNCRQLPHAPFTFTVPYQPGKLTAVGIMDGRAATQCEVCTPAGPARHLTVEPHLCNVPVTDNDALIVHLSLRDGNGTVVPEDKEIELVVASGPAKVVGAARRRSEAGIAGYVLRLEGRGRVKLQGRSAELTGSAELDV